MSSPPGPSLLGGLEEGEGETEEGWAVISSGQLRPRSLSTGSMASVGGSSNPQQQDEQHHVMDTSTDALLLLHHKPPPIAPKPKKVIQTLCVYCVVVVVVVCFFLHTLNHLSDFCFRFLCYLLEVNLASLVVAVLQLSLGSLGPSLSALLLIKPMMWASSQTVSFRSL